MTNNLKKIIYAAALPLALAASAHGQDFGAKDLDSLFNSGKSPAIAEAYDNMANEAQSSIVPYESIVPEKSKIQRNTYSLKICPKEIKDLGTFILNYQRYKEQFQRPWFDLTSRYDNNETDNSGGFPIIIATNTVHTNLEELNKYSLNSQNKAKTIKRKYDLFINKIDEKRCADMTIMYEEDRRSTFGDFLPHN